MAKQFALGLKLFRRARFLDPAILQDDDMVARSEGRKPMGQDDQRPADRQSRQRVVDEVLGVVVDRRFGLLDDQDRGVVKVGPRQCDPKLLVRFEIMARAGRSMVS